MCPVPTKSVLQRGAATNDCGQPWPVQIDLQKFSYPKFVFTIPYYHLHFTSVHVHQIDDSNSGFESVPWFHLKTPSSNCALARVYYYVGPNATPWQPFYRLVLRTGFYPVTLAPLVTGVTFLPLVTGVTLAPLVAQSGSLALLTRFARMWITLQSAPNKKVVGSEVDSVNKA